MNTAIEILNVDRISHGVKAIENKTVINKILLRNIHLELCPSSNRFLGIVNERYGYIKQIIDFGINCSINTDDEFIFNTNLTKEIIILLKNNILRISDIGKLTQNAFHSSFLDSNEFKLIDRKINIVDN